MTRRLLAAGLTALLAVPGSAAASVLYVGDSLGVGTGPYLREQLGGTAIELDAETGRPSDAGVDVLSGLIGSEHDAVVFDLGTNDDPGAPEALASNLARARELAGDRCLVIATLNRPPVNGVSVDGLNRAVEGFAASDQATVLVDWHAEARADPSLLSDGVHPAPEGYALRAQLFAEAIATCASAPATPSPGGGGAARPAPIEPEPTEVEPRPTRRPAPVERLAAELARAARVGAQFG